jgi:hypothetical protein
VFFDGKNVVKLWWIRGELWCIDGHFFLSKNLPLLENIFLEFPVLERGFDRPEPPSGL